MKKNKIITIASLALLSSATFAQGLETGYFNQNYLYGHDLNPAIGNEQNYVAMPAMGNVNINMMGNIGIKDILFKRNGKTVTYLHPDVTASDFCSGINDNNRIYQNLELQILGAGFKAFGGYNTVEINLRENFAARIPGTLLEMTKTGLTNDVYDVSNTSAHAIAYTELAFGHSRQLNDQWRVGAKFKILLGMAHLDATFDKAVLTLSDEGYIAEMDGRLDGGLKGLEYQEKQTTRSTLTYNESTDTWKKSKTPASYVDDIETDGLSVSGFGLAIDLGAEYRLNDEWKFGASLQDIGFLSMGHNYVATTEGTFESNDYVFDANKEADNNIKSTFSAMSDDVRNLFQLHHDESKDGSRTTMLGATFRATAEYAAPFYESLTFGLMNTTRIQGCYSWTNFRLSANVNPVKWFSASGTIGAGSYGCSLGGMLNFKANKGFSFFIATDHAIGKMSEEGIPLSSNGSVSMGMNFPF